MRRHCETCACAEEVLAGEERERRKKARRALRDMRDSLKRLEKVAYGNNTPPELPALSPDPELDAEIEREDAAARAAAE